MQVTLTKNLLIKLIIVAVVLVAASSFLVYEFTLRKVDQQYKVLESSGGSIPISNADLSKDYVSLKGDNPQAGNINISGNVLGNDVQGSTITSTVQNGTSPFNVSSQTVVNNLNADMVDGKHAGDLEPAIQPGNSSEYLSGDKTWQTLNSSAVDLGNVENTSLSTWGGSANIANLGTIAQGIWDGSVIQDAYIGSSANWNLAYADIGQWNGGPTGLNAVNGRTSLGLGSMATQNSNNVSVSGGSIAGSTTWNAGAITSSGAIQGSSLNVGSGTIASGMVNGQTISSSANFTGTVTAASTIATPSVRVAMYPNDNTNPDLVNAGGYQPVQTGTANFGSGAAPFTDRTVLISNHNSRIRQDGYIEKFSMYFASKPSQITAFYFQIWRKAGLIWNQVYSEDEYSKVSAGSINTITLNTPALVQEGDYVAIRWTMNGSDPGNFANTVAGGSVPPATYTIDNSVPSTMGFDFTTGTQSTAYPPINVYMQAPMFVTIGDSIISGLPAHNSYADPYFDYNDKESTIGYQLAQSLSWSYQNMGISGQTVSQIDSRFASDVVGLKPKFAVIEGGINDAMNASPPSTASMVANWTDMLNQATANNITPVMLKIFPCRWSGCTNTVMQTVDQYNAALVSLVASYPNAVLVDATQALGEYRASGPAGNLWDSRVEYSQGVHFTYMGYSVISKVIQDALPVGQVVKGNLTTGDIQINGRLELAGGTGTKYIEPLDSPNYDQTGADLMVKAGSPNGSDLSIDQNGGNLYLSSGSAIGVGSSNIYFQTTAGGSSGTTENTPTTKMAILGNGDVGIGTTSPNNLLQVANLINFDNTSDSTSLGYQAGYSNTGTNNVAIGYNALYTNTTGFNNIAIGVNALQSNTTNGNNIAIGHDVLQNNTLGYDNTSMGENSMNLNTTGYENSAIGVGALKSNTDGYYNVALGMQTLWNNTDGYANTALGLQSLRYNTTGNDNVGFGYQAGYNNQTGSGNVFLGNNAGYNETGSNKLYIANSNTATPLIYGDFSTGQLTLNGSVTVTSAATFQGSLTVTGAATFNGHILTGNAGGSTTVAAGANAGTGATAAITGNDTSGTITVTTGTGPAAGVLATVTFAGAYGAAPGVVLEPTGANGTTLQHYMTSTTTTFSLNSNNAPTASTAYTYRYMVMQ